MSHHPPHIYLDDTWYMLTASTLNRVHYLASERAKMLVRDRLRELIVQFGMTLKAWVILNNHYHLLLKTNVGADLTRFFGTLHGGTSFKINGWDGTRGRQVWHNFWDTCIRDERGFWTRFNYIHQNPVKHGYVGHTADWPFSSYHFYVRKYGEEWLSDCLREYPVIDYSDDSKFDINAE